MSHHDPNHPNDLALAGAIVLLAVAGFAIAAAMLTERLPNPTWDTFWRQLPFWFRLIIGLFAGWTFSIVGGCLAIPRLKARLQQKLPPYYEERDNERIPPALTGKIERFAFTVYVAAYPGAAVAGMMVWLGLKMAANWNKDVLTRTDDDKYRVAARFEQLVWNRHSFLGLLMSFVSMSFAWLGGILARLVMGLDINS